MAPKISRGLYESLLISSVGLLFHINSWSLLQLPFPWRHHLEISQDLEDNYIHTTLPNNASALFLVSVLGYLSMMRPHYPRTLARWKRMTLLVAEILSIVYCGEVILVIFWHPIFMTISMVFYQFADHLERQNKSGEAKWFNFMTRYEAINYLRFLLAVFMFLYTLDLSGWLNLFYNYVCSFSYFDGGIFCCHQCDCPAREVIERQMVRSYRMKQAENAENAARRRHNTIIHPTED